MKNAAWIHRFAACLLIAALSLQLSGCGWFFVPETVTAADPGSIAEAKSTEEVSSSAKTGSSPAYTEPSPEETPAETSAGTESPSEETSADTESSPEELPADTDPFPEETPAETEPSDEAPSAEAPSASGFHIDYYRTPELLRAAAGDALFVDAYNLIDACLNYRTTAKVSCAEEDAGRVLYLADTLCPLLKAFTDISETSLEGGIFSWDFYVSKVEFALIRAEFAQQVADYIEPVLAHAGEYTETELALLLYHAYTAPAFYNFEIISGTFKTRTEAEQHRIHSAYAGIMDHSGVCHDLAGGMTFLFIQAGFNAARVSVINKEEEHSWTLIELDDHYTFVDATWDVGGSFSFFGNSVTERTTEAGGSFKKDEMNIYDVNAPSLFTIVNPGLKTIQRFSRSFTVGSCFELTIDTGTAPHTLTFTHSATGRSIRLQP